VHLTGYWRLRAEGRVRESGEAGPCRPRRAEPRILPAQYDTLDTVFQRIGPGHEVSVLRAGRKRRVWTAGAGQRAFGRRCLRLLSSRGWALWDRLGGFSPAFFMYGEDDDLSFRARKLGFFPPSLRILRSSTLAVGRKPTRSARSGNSCGARVIYPDSFFALAKRSALALLTLRPRLGRRFARPELRSLWRNVGRGARSGLPAVSDHEDRCPARGLELSRLGSNAMTQLQQPTSELIAVCLCTYKRPSQLGRALDSLISIARPASTVFVVVDNDGSDPDVERHVQKFRGASGARVEYVIESSSGISAARNAAIKTAQSLGAYAVAMLDDDEWATHDWLMNCLKCERLLAPALWAAPFIPFFPRTGRNLSVTRRSGRSDKAA